MTEDNSSPGISEYLSSFGDPIRSFLKLEAASGILLMIAMILAMVVKNSPLTEVYQSFLMLDGEVRVGVLSVEKPLVLWVNDLWMAVFFFLVGMEIKYELLCGYLADRSQIALPALGAVGGMAVPAAIFLAFTWGDESATQGWAIPTATDIAFALGVLSLLGSRVSVSIKVFLMTLAILDDLGAIIVIAIFYTANLSVASLVSAAFAVGVLVLLNRLGVVRVAAYIVVGIILWVCVLKSGVHATLAGVITAFAIPLRNGDSPEGGPLIPLIHALHPWVAFGVLPMFAFVNTGITFSGLDAAAVFSAVPIGIAAGLFIGKQLGVFGFVWLAIKLRLAKKPPGVSFAQLYGVAMLCGIGFTMSLFIGGLAFEQGGDGYARADRLGILVGSLLSGIFGYLILRASSKPSGSKSSPSPSAESSH